MTSSIRQADKADKKAAADARAWKKEIDLAGKREKAWRDEGSKIISRYRAEEKKKNRYNVLRSNTEILRPALYNTKPEPDVRRRFRDADPLGKAVSEVLERSLTVFVDGYDVECAAKNDVLDALLPGRGLSRLKYVPRISQTPVPKKEDDETIEGGESIESVDYEQVIREHVDWQDFRHGFGRTWEEVPWEAFRHKLTRKDSEDKFDKNDIASIKYTVPISDDPRKPGDEANETQKVAEFWEVWDKVRGKVFFTNEEAQTLLYTKENPNGEPPLDFPDFWPNPEPLKVIENTGSTLPITHFSGYSEQADELDKISARIDKIVAELKLRGVYDGKLAEISNVMDATDGQLVAIQNAAQYAAAGGLEKAITWMPTDQLVKILESLYEAREKQKIIIDELTGISDIIRGVTDANETYGAQQLKSSYASVRLQRMQKEVQRYERDMLRLAASVMCQKFGTDTFANMTDLKFPTPQEKEQLMMQYQASQQPPQPGQPPPKPIDPQLLKIPTWEEIERLLKSPSMRQYRIDIETDSTIAGTLESDLAGMKEVLTGLSETLTALAPMVQSKALPVEAAKEIAMSVIRRARLGMAVEDAFDKMKMPEPAPPPPDHSIEVAQIKAASDEKVAQMKIQAEGQNSVIEHQAIAATEQTKNQLESQRHGLELQTKAQLDMAEKEHAAQLEQLKMQHEQQMEAMRLENARVIADATNQTNLLIAQLKGEQTAQLATQAQAHEKDVAAMQGEQQTQLQDQKGKQEKAKAEAPTAAAYKGVEQSLAPALKELITHLKKPKRVMRDDAGKVVGIQ